MLTGLFFGLCNGFFDFLDLIFDDPCLPFRRKRDFLKLRVADNDGIVVAGCDAGAKTLSIGGFKVFLAGNEQLCIWGIAAGTRWPTARSDGWVPRTGFSDTGPNA